MRPQDWKGCASLLLRSGSTSSGVGLDDMDSFSETAPLRISHSNQECEVISRRPPPSLQGHSTTPETHRYVLEVLPRTHHCNPGCVSVGVFHFQWQNLLDPGIF